MEESTTVAEEQKQSPGAARNVAGAHGPPRVPVAVRTALGLLLAAGFAGLLWLDSLWRPGFVLAAAALPVVALTGREFCRLVDPDGALVSAPWVMLAGSCLFLLQWAGWAFDFFPGPWATGIAFLTLSACALLTGRVVRGRIRGTQEALSLSLAALIYGPLLLAFLVGIRVNWGVAGVIMTLGVCKVSDSAAYFTGRSLGRTPLAPRISPTKTVEGAVGAVVAAVLAAVLLNAVSPWGLMRPATAVLYGALVGVIAIFGDLAGSILKRQSKVKDSGRLLQGFGGIVDVVDDVLFTAPFSYYFFRVFLG